MVSQLSISLKDVARDSGPVRGRRGYDIPMNTGGWMETEDVHAVLNTDNPLLGYIIWHNDKGRFEVGRLKSIKDITWHPDNMITHVRACQGHTFRWLRRTRLHAMLRMDSRDYVSTICHGTRQCLVTMAGPLAGWWVDWASQW